MKIQLTESEKLTMKNAMVLLSSLSIESKQFLDNEDKSQHFTYVFSKELMKSLNE